MGKFSRIKKYSKPSLEVNERIEKLNKELEKTGVLSEVTNSTVGLYSVIPTNVPDTSGVLGGSFTQSSSSDDSDYGSYTDVSQLVNSSLDKTIFKSPTDDDNEWEDYGITKVYGLVTHGRTLYGASKGVLIGGNQYYQVISPSLADGAGVPGYRGNQGPLSLQQWVYDNYNEWNSQSGKSTVTWKAWAKYNSYFDGDFDGVTVDGQKWVLRDHAILVLREQTSSFKGIGDPDFYPGPVMSRDRDATRISGDVAGANYDLYNWMLKTYGMPAAEWYLNNPKTPPASNPHLPKGAYVPLAGAIMDKFNISPEATNILLAAGNPATGGQPGYYGDYTNIPSAAERSKSNMTWDRHIGEWVPNIGPDVKPPLKGV